MKYFIDLEFLEGKQDKRLFGIKVGETNPTIDLISIGIVAEDGREYYAVSKDFNLYEAWNRSDSVKAVGFRDAGMTKVYEPVYWIRDNVLKVIFNDMESLEFDRTGIPHHEFTYSDFKELLNTHGKSNEQIKEDILEFVAEKDKSSVTVNPFGKDTFEFKDGIEFYGYYSDYDWVCFCWLFGRMIDLPKGFPMFAFDLKQELDRVQSMFNNNNIETINKTWSGVKSEYALNDIRKLLHYPKQTVEHSALHDARFNRDLYNFLKSL